MSSAGSMRQLQLDGTPFNVPGDIDVAEMVSQETEGIKHSGGTMYKVTSKVADREGIVIVCDDDDWELLRALGKRALDGESPYPCSYTNASGTTYVCTAHINIESRQTAENKATIKIIEDQGWEKF